jgi:hypothetical protein
VVWRQISVQAHRVTIVGLATLISTMVSSLATASGSLCREAFSPRTVTFFGVDDAQLKSEITAVLPQIESVLGQPLDISVRLTSNSFYSDAFFLPEERSVRLGVRLGDRTAKSRIGVFVHEAGHAYSHDHFRYLVEGQWLNEADSRAAISSKIKKIEATEEFLDLQSRRNQLADQIHRETNRKGNLAFDVIVHEFRDVKAKLEELLAPSTEATRLLNRRLKIARAFHELFSDVTAALVTREKGIIADALGISQTGPYVGTTPGAEKRRENPSGARPRSFEINRFKDWKPESKFGNEYTVLDPARGVLWELYLKNLPERSGPKFTDAFRIASEREIERLANSEADGDLTSGPSPAEINRDFLREFRSAALERKLQSLK